MKIIRYSLACLLAVPVLVGGILIYGLMLVITNYLVPERMK